MKDERVRRPWLAPLLLVLAMSWLGWSLAAGTQIAGACSASEVCDALDTVDGVKYSTSVPPVQTASYYCEGMECWQVDQDGTAWRTAPPQPHPGAPHARCPSHASPKAQPCINLGCDPSQEVCNTQV